MLHQVIVGVLSNPFILLPLLLCIPLIPIGIICLNDKRDYSKESNSIDVVTPLVVGAGVYTIYKLHKVEKELSELKDKVEKEQYNGFEKHKYPWSH